MRDYFLRAPGKEQIDQALINAGLLTTVDGYPVTNPDIKMLVYVGCIPEETGRMIKDENGFEYPESILSAEYHVNLRGTLTQEQVDALPIIPWPKNPYSIPAGGLIE
ncbi:hypothetical protein ACBP93_06580 [Paenalcaligenes hominis]|uniref:hypothetical protein n=1 Tax=Paenalcaligenes hominis TaxID=643674 RepID=UPI003523B9F1